MKKTLSFLMALGWLACAALSPIRDAVFAEEAGASSSVTAEVQPTSAPDNAAESIPSATATRESASPDSNPPADEPASPSESQSPDAAPTSSPAAPDSNPPADEPASPSESQSLDATPTSSPAAPDSNPPADEPASPSESQSPDATPTPTQPDESAPPAEEALPSVTLTVAPPQDYQPQTWRSTAPTFTLSCGLPDLTGYAYAVSADGGAPAQLEGNSYTLTQEGAYTLIFSLLNGAGEIVTQSGEFSVWLDATPPSAQFSVNGLALSVAASDSCSGLAAISLDGGLSWQPLTVDENGVGRFLHTADEAQTFDAGAIIVRDAAGNAAANSEAYVLAPQERPGGDAPGSGMPGGFSSGGKRGGAGASGSVTRTVSHAASTVTDVIAYDGVALVVEDDAMTLLTLGGETLDLSVRRVDASGGEAYTVPFTAELGLWNDEPIGGEDADTLILSVSEASPEAAEYEWLFNGRVSKTLAASGIDYLALRVGERVTAFSTAGFAAGRAYDGFRSAGVASKAFEYCLRMADDEREPLALTVTVEDEQFLVTENPSDDFYYYDLYTGSQELLNTPFGAYSPMG